MSVGCKDNFHFKILYTLLKSYAARCYFLYGCIDSCYFARKDRQDLYVLVLLRSFCSRRFCGELSSCKIPHSALFYKFTDVHTTIQSN